MTPVWVTGVRVRSSLLAILVLFLTYDLVTYNVGDAVSNFPMAIFKAVGSATIKFNLSSSQRELSCWDVDIWDLTVRIFSWCTHFGDRDDPRLCWWSSSSTSQWLDRTCSLSSQSTGFSRYCFNLLCAFLKLAHATTDRCYPWYLERKRELICGFCMVNLMRIDRTSCISWTFVSFLCYRFLILLSYFIKSFWNTRFWR